MQKILTINMKSKKNPQLIFGRHPVIDAIKEGKSVDKVVIQRGTTGPLEIEMRKLCKKAGIVLNYVPKERMNRLAAGGNHQGIMAYLSLIEYHTIDNLLPFLYEQGKTPLLVILDNVTDVRNFGAIARTAEGIGADGLIIPKKGGALINPDALKTSAGTLTYLPVCRENNLKTTVDFLQQSGIQVVASDLKATKMIHELDFTLPTAIIVGSEDEGTSTALLKRADETFLIPMQGKTDSYNVSVAAGMMLYEAVRQRLNP